jgi:hypothetical protein
MARLVLVAEGAPGEDLPAGSATNQPRTGLVASPVSNMVNEQSVPMVASTNNPPTSEVDDQVGSFSASAHGVSCSSTAAVSIPVEANPDQQDGSLDYSANLLLKDLTSIFPKMLMLNLLPCKTVMQRRLEGAKRTVSEEEEEEDTDRQYNK